MLPHHAAMLHHHNQMQPPYLQPAVAAPISLSTSPPSCPCTFATATATAATAGAVCSFAVSQESLKSGDEVDALDLDRISAMATRVHPRVAVL